MLINKTTENMETKAMKSAVKTVATEAIQDMKFEALEGLAINAVNFSNLIESTILVFNYTFETPVAESLFITLVKNEIREQNPEMYAKAWPPVGMDQNGNWTTNAARWA